MSEIILTILATNILIIPLAFLLGKSIYKSKTPEICDHALCKTICKLRKEINLSNKERDIAIDDSMQTLRERNEALLMLSQKIK